MKNLATILPEFGRRSSTFYGFRLPNGCLARLCSWGVYDSYWELTNNSNDPVFLTEDKQVIANILFEDVPEYNSEQNRPSWGQFAREQLTPVSLQLEVEITPVDIKPVEDVGPWVVDTRTTCRSAKEGQILAFGSIYNQRLVMEVREAEEEWADLCKDKQGVIFICPRS